MFIGCRMMIIQSLMASVAFASLPPGPGPFGSEVMAQPVLGAQRAQSVDGWKLGKLCDVSKPPYMAVNGTNATKALQQAIVDCGDLAEGGTVLVPSGMTLLSASLFLRSNLTLRVEKGSAIVGTATGTTDTPTSTGDAPIVYTRRGCIMTDAHAGFINGGVCLKKKDPLVGWDDCSEWSKLENVVIEGGGTLDANGSDWYEVWGKHSNNDDNQRPMMLDLLWIDGLTIRDMNIRRPGFWTVHPTFSNNVRVTNNSIITTGSNTDGCDPDSSWNVYIAGNNFSTGDDCIAIKSGRDWSGRMVNISTQNVLAEQNYFLKGHGVSIGSETSGWVRNVTIRDSVLDGTNLAVRLKTCRGRGGGIENILYENLTGKVISAIQLTLNYEQIAPTNVSATPTIRNITIRNIDVETEKSNLLCDGLPDSMISGIVFDNVTVTGKDASKSTCEYCSIKADASTTPQPKCAA
eukprot:m.32462 g.32462  ORF g.32462 m.32462 type:complete len:462 (+) comp16649_c0_seq1:163-1548(+)